MNKKKKMKTANIVLIVIAVVLITFTIANLVLFAKIGSVPDTLIVSVFGACLGEFSILGAIRTMKQKYPNSDEPEFDDNGNIMG